MFLVKSWFFWMQKLLEFKDFTIDFKRHFSDPWVLFLLALFFSICSSWCFSIFALGFLKISDHIFSSIHIHELKKCVNISYWPQFPIALCRCLFPYIEDMTRSSISWMGTCQLTHFCLSWMSTEHAGILWPSNHLSYAKIRCLL